MRIKHDFLEIIILQPERRFNNGSEREKVVNILNNLIKNDLFGAIDKKISIDDF